jgi:signal recognition particle subunit SRP54
MMEQLRSVRDAVSPRETYLVLDGLSGQDAVNVALEFERRAGYTAAVLTKMDGDSRGGAALSFKAVTGKPVRFVGTGEGVEGLEVFDPARMAGRILGMGDVLGLVEKAQESFDRTEAEKLEKKLRRAEFTLEDFAGELGRLRKMGSMSELLAMLPGGMIPAGAGFDPARFSRMEAIIGSMTPRERRKPEIIDGSRRKRIARGSGTTVREVNRLLQEFRTMQTMLKKVKKARHAPSLFRMRPEV